MTPGWIVPAAVVEAAVRDFLNGVEALRIALDPSEYDALLARAYRNLGDAEISQVKAFLARDIRLVKNYPQGTPDLPLVCFLLKDEHRTKYVGDMMGEFIGEDDSRAYVSAERWRTTIEVIAFSEHPQEIEWLHHLIKFGISLKRRWIEDQGIKHQEAAGSQDLGFEPRYLEAGRYVYRRSIVFTMEYDQTDAGSAADLVQLDEHISEVLTL